LCHNNAALGQGSYGGAVLVRSSSGNSGVEASGCSFTNNSAELTVGLLFMLSMVIVIADSKCLSLLSC
jgi:hypothetical protein